MPTKVFMDTRHDSVLVCWTFLVQTFTCFYFLGSTISELILFTSSTYYTHFTLPAVLLRFDNGSIMQNLSPLPSTLNKLTNLLTTEQVCIKLEHIIQRNVKASNIMYHYFRQKPTYCIDIYQCLHNVTHFPCCNVHTQEPILILFGKMFQMMLWFLTSPTTSASALSEDVWVQQQHEYELYLN